jgi:xanthine dehydrogenase accessory factor
MQELREDIDRWRSHGEQVALATVVRTMGSSPRQVGAKMAVSSSGSMAGSVSGGCIEGAVFEACQEVLLTGNARLLHFGVADETAWEVGLACGGTIDVFIEALDSEYYEQIQRAIAAGGSLASATIAAGDHVGTHLLIGPDGSHTGDLHDPALQAQVISDADALLAHGETRLLSYADGNLQIFIESFVPPPTLYMVGGVHIAGALTSMAAVLGFRTVVIDARSAFASAERFAHADELVVAWPDEALAGRLDPRCAVAVLTHDPKLDDPALHVALRSPARYIGALGSPKTHAKRIERLREAGFSDDDIARIHGPIGLKLGAKKPEEIALSILAQIVQVYHS